MKSRVRFDEREVQYDVQELDELAPSYAITIHKSQGSEYPCGVIPIHTPALHHAPAQPALHSHYARQATAGRLVGTQKALAIAVKKQDIRRRITTLKIRLQEVG
jgi:exodeoxyribonuclease V alpha subunit